MYFKMIKVNRQRVTASIISLLFLVAAGQAFAEVAVVANKGISVDSVTVKEAKKIWLGKTKSLGGTSVKLADLPKGNASRDHFYTSVVKKSEKKLKAYWAKIIFAGKGSPPKTFGSDAEVISWVASTPGAVGYIESAANNDSVKVLMISK